MLVVGDATIPEVRVQLVKDPGIAREAYPVFKSSADTWQFARSMFTPETLDREHFWVLILNNKNQVVGHHLASVGILDASLVHPREIFKAAIVYNAAAIICIHNHPSGDPTPSKEDHDITARLAEAGNILGVPVLDHLVLGHEGYTSFNDRGWV